MFSRSINEKLSVLGVTGCIFFPNKEFRYIGFLTMKVNKDDNCRVKHCLDCYGLRVCVCFCVQKVFLKNFKFFTSN
jgi:hypothetical protein